MKFGMLRFSCFLNVCIFLRIASFRFEDCRRKFHHVIPKLSKINTKTLLHVFCFEYYIFLDDTAIIYIY